MRIALSLADEQLARRVKRVLASFPQVVVADDAGRTAAVDGDIPVPSEPTRHLAALLATEVERRSGAGISTIAATVRDTPLRSGTAVGFPKPLGTVWGEIVGGVLLAPVSSRYAGALASNDTLALAVIDDGRFLDAIVTAAPIISEARGVTELAAMSLAGLSLAEPG